MSQLRLRDTETRASRLPELCMKCGEPSETYVKKNFQWYPPWVILIVLLSLIPGLIVMAILTKRMSVEVPLCSRHSGHFWKRTLLTWLAVLGCFGVGALGCAGAIALSDKNPNDGTGPVLAIFTFVIALIGAIIVIAVAQNTAIRPKLITDREITLIKIDDTFIDAVEEMRETRRSRRDEEDEFEERRSPRRRPREEYDDEDRPSPRRRDSYRAERADEDRPRRRDEED